MPALRMDILLYDKRFKDQKINFLKCNLNELNCFIIVGPKILYWRICEIDSEALAYTSKCGSYIYSTSFVSALDEFQWSTGSTIELDEIYRPALHPYGRDKTVKFINIEDYSSGYIIDSARIRHEKMLAEFCAITKMIPGDFILEDLIGWIKKTFPNASGKVNVIGNAGKSIREVSIINGAVNDTISSSASEAIGDAADGTASEAAGDAANGAMDGAVDGAADGTMGGATSVTDGATDELYKKLLSKIISSLNNYLPHDVFCLSKKRRYKAVKKAAWKIISNLGLIDECSNYNILKDAVIEAANIVAGKCQRVTREDQMRSRSDENFMLRLYQVLKRYFPDLIEKLGKIELDYIPKKGHDFDFSVKVILVLRILMGIFHLNSMRGMTEELFGETQIRNIGTLCDEDNLPKIPHHNTVNNYLEHINPEDIQAVIVDIVKVMMRNKAFNGGKIFGQYWHLIMDGTQMCSDSGKKRKLEGGATRTHNRNTDKEYVEHYWYVVELKVVFAPNITISLLSEFVENQPDSSSKQDCEINAAKRLLKKLHKEFPRTNFLIGADSLYACEPIMKLIRSKGWHFVFNFKPNRIPSVGESYNDAVDRCPKIDSTILLDGDETFNYSFLKCAYQDIPVTIIEYKRSSRENPSYVLTDLIVTTDNVEYITTVARRRWNIESCFNEQKNHGYRMTHVFSYNYNAAKCHYLLIQIGHAISQIFDAWVMEPSMMRTSKRGRHSWLLNAMKNVRLDSIPNLDANFQIRFPYLYWDDDYYYVA